MKKQLAILLKVLSIAMLPLVLYPPYLLLAGLFGYTDGPVLLLYFLLATSPLVLASYFLSYAALRFVLKHPKMAYADTLSKAVCILLCLALSAAAGLCFPSGLIAFCIVLALLFFLLCMWVRSCVVKRYDDILYDLIFLIGVLSYLICYIVEFFLEFNELASFSHFAAIPLLLVFIGVSAIALNQANIDDLMKRRRHNFEDLPSKIRSHNFLLIAVIFVVVLLLYLFRQPIIALLSSAGGLLLDVCLLLFQGFLLLTQSNPEGGEGGDSTPSESLPSQDFMGMGEASHQSYISIIVIAVLVICLVLLLFFKGKDFGLFLINRFRAVRAGIKRFLRRRRNGAMPEEELNGLYVDTVEDIVPVQKKQNKEKKLKLPNGKRFGRLLRQLEKIEDPVQRVRMSYRTLLSYLKQKGIDIRSSDTARQIDQKTQAEPFHHDFDTATGVYESVRYADRIPGETQLEQMSQSVRSVLNSEKK